MSDEGESAAGDGDKSTTGRGQTAVATRPLRPSGKRSRQVTEAVEAPPIEKVDEKKDKGKKKAKAAKKGAGDHGPRNPITFIWNYLKQVVAELRKVIWPNRKQMATYTAVVLAFLAFMVTLIGFVDLGLGRFVLWVFG